VQIGILGVYSFFWELTLDSDKKQPETALFGGQEQ